MGPIKPAEDQGVDARYRRTYRDPAVILIDQLKEIYIDGELEPIDTDATGIPRSAQGLHRRRSTSPARWSTTPIRCFYENYACGAESATTTAIAIPRSTS